MSKVYLVTSGEYSDYRVESVWSARELAEAEVGRKNANRSTYSRAEVEEYWLDDNTADAEGRELFCVRFFHGKVDASKESGAVAGDDGRLWITRENRGESYYWNGDGHIYVRASDPEGAIKIAADRRAYVMATQAIDPVDRWVQL